MYLRDEPNLSVREVMMTIFSIHSSVVCQK